MATDGDFVSKLVVVMVEQVCCWYDRCCCCCCYACGGGKNLLLKLAVYGVCGVWCVVWCVVGWTIVIVIVRVWWWPFRARVSLALWMLHLSRARCFTEMCAVFWFVLLSLLLLASDFMFLKKLRDSV